MPAIPRPRKDGVYVEIDKSLRAEFRDFAEARGNTFARELADAMRRHLAYPPPAEPAPLPDAAKPGRKKTSKKSADSS